MKKIIITILACLWAMLSSGCEGTTYYGTYNPATDENAYIAQGINNFLAGLAQQQQPKDNYQWFAPQGDFVDRPDGSYRWNAFKQRYEYIGPNVYQRQQLNNQQQLLYELRRLNE